MATVDGLKAEYGVTHLQARLVAEQRRDRGKLARIRNSRGPLRSRAGTFDGRR